jgi:hypothetical protein
MFDKTNISNIVFSFGTPHGNKFGTLTLKEDNTIQGYKHENEQYWDLVDGQIIFLNKKKNITSRLNYVEQLQAWFGKSDETNIPIYLYPLINLNRDNIENKHLPPLVLNGIPYNGSIFFEKALTKCGWSSSNISLKSKNIVDINAETDEQEKERFDCPVQLIPPLLHGQTVISNLDSSEIIKAIRTNKIPTITIVRNVKDAILDFFETELNKKNSKLKNLTEKKQAEEFIALYGGNMLLHMRNVLRSMINDRPKIILRYEDNINGIIPNEVANILDSYQQDTSKILAKELPIAYHEHINKKNKQQKVKWSDTLDNYYRTLGLASFNHILGYLD